MYLYYTVYFCFYSSYVLTLYISIVLLYKGEMLNPRCANQKLGFRSLRDFVYSNCINFNDYRFFLDTCHDS